MGLRETKGPLRTIIGYVQQDIDGTQHTITCEKLECGHIVRIRQDFIGETNAYRRRCRFCRDIQGSAGMV